MFFYNFFFYHCICNTLSCWHVSSAWIPFYKHPKLFMRSVQRPSDCSQHSPNTNNATMDAATHHARACLPELPGVLACGEHSRLGYRAQMPSALLEAAHCSLTHAPTKRSLKRSHCSMSSLAITKLPKFAPLRFEMVWPCFPGPS